jgi:hypothetical protein
MMSLEEGAGGGGGVVELDQPFCGHRVVWNRPNLFDVIY